VHPVAYAQDATRPAEWRFCWSSIARTPWARRWFLLAQAKQVPRARYARRRGKASRGRHLFASDEELVAGLDV
jgi:hypothetical protein